MKGGEELRKRNIVVNSTANEINIAILGDIVNTDWDAYTSDDVYPSAVKTALANSKGKNVTIHINSGGGDLFAGIAIYNMIKGCDASSVTVYVDGLAASAASIIALAGDKVIMPTGSMMMIHEAACLVYGNSAELLEQAEVLKKCTDSIIDIYVANSKNKTAAEFAEMIANETWLKASEAAEIFGNITTADGQAQAMADSKMYAYYKHTPQNMRCMQKDNEEKRQKMKQFIDNAENFIFMEGEKK